VAHGYKLLAGERDQKSVVPLGWTEGVGHIANTDRAKIVNELFDELIVLVVDD
jgi:hypothetical protein